LIVLGLSSPILFLLCPKNQIRGLAGWDNLLVDAKVKTQWPRIKSKQVSVQLHLLQKHFAIPLHQSQQNQQPGLRWHNEEIQKKLSQLQLRPQARRLQTRKHQKQQRVPLDLH
tara:strand:- start:508 stop:846 length:339 start_codon:yes stop_codon:yes gene_type:complete